MAGRDLLEELFNSVDLLIDTKVNNLNFDKTELCTVEQVKDNNQYYVSNGSAKYYAYASEGAKYEVGDSVYVTIPQGNYNNQKLIISKYTKTTAEKVN